MDRKDGIYTDITDEEYFANTDRINSSELKKLYLKSEKHLNLKESFAGARFGNVAHKFILEPDKFDEDCVLIAPKTKTETSKEFKGLIEDNKGKFCYTKEELETIKKWKTPIDFSKTQNELVLYATCPVTGLRLKAKMDALNESESALYDVKTTSNILRFENDCFNNGNVFSLCYYNYLYLILKGESLSLFKFVVFESKEPHNVAIFPIEMTDIEVYMRVMQKTLADYKKILDSGVKRDYIPSTIKLKSWQTELLKNYLDK